MSGTKDRLKKLIRAGDTNAIEQLLQENPSAVNEQDFVSISSDN